jgi:hypothetical protein
MRALRPTEPATMARALVRERERRTSLRWDMTGVGVEKPFRGFEGLIYMNSGREGRAVRKDGVSPIDFPRVRPNR